MNKENDKLKLPAINLPPDIIILVCIIASALLFAAGLIVPVAPWLKTFIFASCVVLTGYDIVIDTVLKLLKERDFNSNFLIVLAAAGALIIGQGDDGAAIMLIFRLGEFLHSKVVKNSANMIESYMDLRPEVVNAVINGAIVHMAPGKVNVGDIISVSPGERIALDGTVVSGSSELDTSAVNGGAAPVPVCEGSDVLSGSVNLNGVLNIRVTVDFDHSTVSRVLKLVEKAENKKAKLEKKIKKFARIFTPAIVGAALIIGVLIPLFGNLAYEPWLNRAFGFLVISSPSAMVVSVALTFFAGIGGASKKGILFKGSNVVDTVANTTSVVFVKTGTLTDGTFRIVDVHSNGLSDKRLMMLAAYAELLSNHPIGQAIVAAADIMPDFTKVADYREFVGKGTEILIGSNTVTAGNLRMMEESGVTPDVSLAEYSVVYIAVNGQYAGRILLHDTVRPDSKKAVRDLHAIGIDRIVIFTGDKKEVAADVAGQLGIKEYYAECLPEDKYSRLKGLMDMQLAGDKLIFVGSGTDDLQALRMADVGIILGGLGSAEAIEAADIIIMTPDPSIIPSAITIARRTKSIAGQNAIMSLGLKGLVLILVMLGIASAWMAVLADAVFSLIVAFNAMRAFGISRSDVRKALPELSKSEEDDLAE